MNNIEKLGAFYLGRSFDIDQRAAVDEESLLYDSKDLTTHAVIVGMTGSGKTGLGVTLLEEAAIDGIPAIIIDPKGDLGNLMLNFPELRPSDFRTWVDAEEAARHGKSAEEYARETASRWRQGLADWGQAPDRIQRLRDAADVAIYTPGSGSGLQLTVFKSLDAPTASLLEDADAMRERVSAAASGLLTLLGIDGDPLRSREHILLSNILDHTWRAGANLDLPALIRNIQSPPVDKIGVMDLETVYPSADRMQLAMMINNVLASPGFSGWLEGEPLDIQRLLYTPQGKPRLSILSIAHLGDRERMFFVTLLLNEVVAWMRSQPGTSSLRALLYMDEVFGYLPPTANPPSKTPMLTLLKQARAYGLGLVLATQNPVDLDYKALSNAGTWFLGRLQTERDKQRVLDGLEGASTSAGTAFDRRRVEQVLSGLSSRVFLMNNVHEDAPIVFQTRWALSYLRGPLTRDQIQALMADRKQAESGSAVQPSTATPSSDANRGATTVSEPVGGESAETEPPILPAGVTQRYVASTNPIPSTARVIYRPAVLGMAHLHYVDARSRSGIDLWKNVGRLAPIRDASVAAWEDSERIDQPGLAFADAPTAGARFGSLAGEAMNAKSYSTWAKELKDVFYRGEPLEMRFCPSLKTYSEPEESEGDFRARLNHQLREKRDLEIEKLRKKYTPKIERLQDRIRSAEQRVEVEKSQASSATVSAAMSIGSSLLGALFGRKLASRTNVSGAATSVRSMGRAASQRGDIKRAEANAQAIRDDLAAMEAEFEKEITRINEGYTPEDLSIEPYEVTPRKSDIDVEEVILVWIPFVVDADGLVEPA